MKQIIIIYSSHQSSIQIELKWDNVVFVKNRSDKFVRSSNMKTFVLYDFDDIQMDFVSMKSIDDKCNFFLICDTNVNKNFIDKVKQTSQNIKCIPKLLWCSLQRPTILRLRWITTHVFIRKVISTMIVKHHQTRIIIVIKHIRRQNHNWRRVLRQRGCRHCWWSNIRNTSWTENNGLFPICWKLILG